MPAPGSRDAVRRRRGSRSQRATNGSAAARKACMSTSLICTPAASTACARCGLGLVPQRRACTATDSRGEVEQQLRGRAAACASKPLPRHQQHFRAHRNVASRTSSARPRMPAGMEAAHVVLRAVDQVRLQRGETSPKGSGVGLAPSARISCDEDVRRRHAHLQAVQVAPARARRGACCRSSARRNRRWQGQPGRALGETAQTRAPARHPSRGACAPSSRTRRAGAGTRVAGKALLSAREVHAGDVDDAVARQVDGVGFAAELAGVVHTDAKAALGLAATAVRRSSAPPPRWDSRRRARRRPSATVAGSRAARPWHRQRAEHESATIEHADSPLLHRRDQPGMRGTARDIGSAGAEPSKLTRPLCPADVVDAGRGTGRQTILARAQRPAAPGAVAEREGQCCQRAARHVAAPPLPTSFAIDPVWQGRCGRSPCASRAMPGPISRPALLPKSATITPGPGR